MGARLLETTARVAPQPIHPHTEEVALITTTMAEGESFFLRATAIPFILTDFLFR